MFMMILDRQQYLRVIGIEPLQYQAPHHHMTLNGAPFGGIQPLAFLYGLRRNMQ